MKVLKGYSRYKISDMGNIYNIRLNRKVPSTLRDKYPRVNLYDDNKKRYFWIQISKLMKDNILSVPAHLIGYDDMLLIVKYKNNNQSDCSKDNLQIELSKNRRFPYCNRCYTFHQIASKGGVCV